VTGGLRLPRRYLPQYLGIKPGMPYSRARVLRIRDRLNTLLFVETGWPTPPSLSPATRPASTCLCKKNAPAASILLSDCCPSPTVPTGACCSPARSTPPCSMRSTSANASPSNWSACAPKPKNWTVQAGLPYLFGLPFGMEGRLNIFRRDSTWVDAQSEYRGAIPARRRRFRQVFLGKQILLAATD
jgi:hypothetical protein